MLRKHIILIYIVVLANAIANACKQDLLVDDFSSLAYGNINGESRQVNRLGGDYAAQNVSFGSNPTAKFMTLTPVNGGLPNYFTVKFDPAGCFDLREYTHLVFNLSAPRGSSFQIGFTARGADCLGNGTNSVQTSITRYTTPNDTFQLVRIPTTDFFNNVAGTNFDWIRTQDIRFTNLQPATGSATFIIQNLYLVGSCNGLPSLQLGPSGASSPSQTGNVAPAAPTKAPSIDFSAFSDATQLEVTLVVGFLVGLLTFMFTN